MSGIETGVRAPEERPARPPSQALPWLAMAFVLLGAARSSAGPPPVVRGSVPLNETGGSIEAEWVAPFVQYVESRGRGWSTTQVRWYSTSGDLLAQTDTLRSSASRLDRYFVSGSKDHRAYHGMYNDWHLPAPSSEQIAIASSDGRVFVQFLRRGDVATGVSVYVEGRHATDLGPLPGMKLASHSVGFDGAVGVVLAAEDGTRPPWVLTTNVTGKPRMSRQVPGALRLHVAPGGTGGLVWREDGGLAFLTDHGELVEVPVDPKWQLSRWLAIWHPDRPEVVLGSETLLRHALVDCSTGEVRWIVDVPAPHLGREGVQPFGEYVFQSGLDTTPSAEGQAGGRRVIRALDIGTGRLVAQWRSGRSPAYSGWQECGALMMRDGRLYYVAKDAFSEIRTADVEMAGEGCCPWQLPSTRSNQGERPGAPE